MTEMNAVLLAGGRGRRLEPLTLTIPKVLAPVGDLPIVEIVLRQLKAKGFSRVTLTLGYLGELVRAFIESHPKRFSGLDIELVVEDEPSGTAGSLAHVDGIDSTFLVMNGDILTTLDYRRLIEHHRASGAKLTIACRWERLTVESGVLHFEQGSGRLSRFEEKPVLEFPVNMGVYVYEPDVLEHLPEQRPLDQPAVIEHLLSRGEIVSCYETDCLWFDIGTRAGSRLALEAFEADPAAFLPRET